MEDFKLKYIIIILNISTLTTRGKRWRMSNKCKIQLSVGSDSLLSLRQWFSNFHMHQRHLEGFPKCSFPGFTSDFLLQQAWEEPKKLHFHKFAGEVDAASPGCTLWEMYILDLLQSAVDRYFYYFPENATTSAFFHSTCSNFYFYTVIFMHFNYVNF